MIVVHHLSNSHSHVILWLLEELGVEKEGKGEGKGAWLTAFYAMPGPLRLTPPRETGGV